MTPKEQYKLAYRLVRIIKPHENNVYGYCEVCKLSGIANHAVIDNAFNTYIGSDKYFNLALDRGW